VLEPPEDQGAVRQLLLGGKSKDSEATAVGARKKSDVQGLGRTEEEERIRALAAVKGRGRDGG
jgi:hypothetical protein